MALGAVIARVTGKKEGGKKMAETNEKLLLTVDIKLKTSFNKYRVSYRLHTAFAVVRLPGHNSLTRLGAQATSTALKSGDHAKVQRRHLLIGYFAPRTCL